MAPQTASPASSIRARFFPEAVELDSCTMKQVTIRNYTGDLVRFIESMPYDNTLGYPWDAKDDLGNPVPSGYYPIFSRCLDSRNEFTFRGHYFVWEVGEMGVCEWPLWLQRLEPPPAARVLQFYRFPLFSSLEIHDPDGGGRIVPFLNPFLVRVEAPGMVPFETEVTLAADQWSPVRVTWTPATPFGATAATTEAR
jgi:hypothetical protein